MAIPPIAIQAGITMPGASAYALAAALLSPVVPLPYEPLASYDWIFGSDYGTFADLISGSKLQQNISLAITSGGSGYEATGALSFSGGGATQQATGVWFATSGAITGVYLTSPGAGYTSSPAVVATTASGTGGALTATIRGLPAAGANSLVLSATSGTGLITPITDSNDQTLCAVVKVNKNPTSAVGLLFGSLFASSATATTLGGTAAGSGLYVQAGGYAANSRPGGSSAVPAPTNAPDGGYAFVAMSEAAAGGRIVYWGGPAPTVYTATQVRTMLAKPVKVALGQAYYSPNGQTHEIAEFFYIPRSTTQAELDAIYARCKTRMADRGITIY